MLAVRPYLYVPRDLVQQLASAHGNGVRYGEGRGERGMSGVINNISFTSCFRCCSAAVNKAAHQYRPSAVKTTSPYNKQCIR